MTEKENTHILFDGGKIVISPNMRSIINFLQEIEKEVETFFNREKHIEKIKKYFLDVWRFVKFLSDKLKSNSIDFEYKIDDPSDIADSLKTHRPIRSEMIALFAYLETLNCFDVVYSKNISSDNPKVVISHAKNNLQFFLNTFCLCSENTWLIDNPERAKKLTANNIMRLRNSLTHFYSLSSSGLNIANAYLDVKSRKLEKMVGNNLVFISPEDLYEIIRGAAHLMIKQWSSDCEDSFKNNNNNFEQKIKCVKALVERSGAVIVYAKDLKI